MPTSSTYNLAFGTGCCLLNELNPKDQDRGAQIRPRTADDLIIAVSQKLEANRAILSRSLRYGRIIWRLNRKDGVFEINFEPKL